VAKKQAPAFETITGWWRDDFNEDLASGDGIDTWQDYSGQGGDFTQVTAPNQPEWETKVRWGKPALRFGRAAATHYMDGPDCNTLFATGQATLMIAFYLTNITTEQYLFTDSTHDIAMVILTNGELRGRVAGQQISIGGPLDQFQLNYPAWHVGIVQHVGGNCRVYLDDPLKFKFIAAGNSGAMGLARIGANPSGLEPLQDAYIGEIITTNTNWNDANVSRVFAWMAGRWLDRGDPLARMRDAASRRLHRFERPRRRFYMTTPYKWIDSGELYTPHALSHGYVPTTTGGGAGIERWERAVVVPTERRENIDTYSLEFTFEDRRGLSHQYVETGVATGSQDDRRDGVKISGLGVHRFSVSGVTKCWVESAGGLETGRSGGVVEVPAGVEASEFGGIVTEPAVNQYMLRTSFINELTGLTKVGEGASGGAIDTIQLNDPANIQFPGLFSPQVTEWCARFTAGDPTHAADMYLQWPLTTNDELIQANQRLCFSMDNTLLPVTPFGAGLKWALQTDVDSTWWDDLNETWSGSLVWNLGLDTNVTTYGRSRSNVIMWPNAIGRALVYVGLPSGSAAGQVCLLYHVQLE